METKTCSKCCEALPLTSFNKSSRTKDGLRWSCKKCIAIYSQSETAKSTRKRSRAKHRKDRLTVSATPPSGTISPTEASSRLNLSIQRISHLVTNGSIDSIRIGRRVWLKLASIDEYTTKKGVSVRRKPSNSKGVYQFNIEGELIAEYDSIPDASTKTGLSYGCIVCAIRRVSIVSRRWFFSRLINPPIKFAEPTV